VASEDTSIQQQLVRFMQQHDTTKYQPVGILSIEDGYMPALDTAIAQQYGEAIQLGLLLTAGMQVRKEAGSNQASLIQWLTDKDSNGHYDEDADETGKKFFVSGDGELFAVLGKPLSLDDPIVERILQSR
jgi:hypothetical protein